VYVCIILWVWNEIVLRLLADSKVYTLVMIAGLVHRLNVDVYSLRTSEARAYHVTQSAKEVYKQRPRLCRFFI
jgi:hypothetical protein